MSTRVVLTLPDEVYQRAEELARSTSRDVAEVLAETLASSLLPFGRQTLSDSPVVDFSDDEVLAAIELQLPSDLDRRFRELLNRQQAGDLTPGSRAELLAFMQIYQEGLLLKARALREAVQRGLRAPLES